MNQNLEALSAFLLVAVIRNGSTKNIIMVQENALGYVNNLTGTIIDPNNKEVTSYWNLDGSNRIHGFDYDLVRNKPLADFIDQNTPPDPVPDPA